MYRLNFFPQLALIATLFTLASCTFGVNPSPYLNIPTASPTPTALPKQIQSPTSIPPTPIEPTPVQLPFNEGNAETEYCNNPPGVYLPISEAQGLTDDDITEKLMSLHLDYYNNPQAPDFCRIDGYRIERVFYDESMTSPLVTRMGDFMRGVMYSVKLIQVPSIWMNSGGEIDQQNWLHTGYIIAIYRIKADSVYTIGFRRGAG